MNLTRPHRRRRPAPEHDPSRDPEQDDDLAAAITAALAERAATVVHPEVVRHRIEVEARRRAVPAPTLVRRAGRAAGVGVLAGGVVLGGTLATAAAAPGSSVASVVRGASWAVGLEWLQGSAQDEAFWAAGYTVADRDALAELWSVDDGEVKAIAGQMLMDGEQVPLAPSGPPTTTEPPPPLSPQEREDARASDAFWDAGYTVQDRDALAELWDQDPFEVKVRAGEMLVRGEEVPVEPSGEPAAVTGG